MNTLLNEWIKQEKKQKIPQSIMLSNDNGLSFPILVRGYNRGSFIGYKYELKFKNCWLWVIENAPT